MKLGLLICDHVPAAHLSWAGSYPDMIHAWLPSVETEIFHVVDDDFPPSAMHCDAWLVNGSRFSVYEEIPWIRRLQAFVREIQRVQRPYVGLCFGHQLLAESLGGKVAPSPQGWCVGVHRFTIHQQHAWMNPFPDEVQLLMMCQDQVQQLPPGAELLATSSDCPVGMFLVDGRMLGIQAHPEFTPSYDRALMESRVERIGAEKVQRGLDSLQTPLDANLIGEWVKQLLLLS